MYGLSKIYRKFAGGGGGCHNKIRNVWNIYLLISDYSINKSNPYISQAWACCAGILCKQPNNNISVPDRLYR